jgi:multiple sugar transport system substrate-binding protein
MYRKDIFDANGLTPPTNIDELVAVSKKLKEINPEMAGIVVRGSLNWATIHPGFMTMYASQGCVDYDENMVPQMNSPCAVEVTEKWIDMVKSAGPEAWTTYTWYQAGADFGVRASCHNVRRRHPGLLPEPGKRRGARSARQRRLGARPARTGRRAQHQRLDLVAGHERRLQEEGRGLALHAVGHGQGLPHHRRRRTAIHDGQPGAPVRYRQPRLPGTHGIPHRLHERRLQTISEGDMRIHFTPSPIFFETTTEWAQALQDIYAGADAQTRLDALVESLTEQLQDVGILE